MSALSDLAARVAALEDSQVRLRLGTVTATTPFTVSLGGADPIVGIGRLTSTTFSINDVVVVLSTKASSLVIGRLT